MAEQTRSASPSGLVLRAVGSCDRKIYGMLPAERLRRQINEAGATASGVLVADAGTVIGDSTLHWLIGHPGQILSTSGGAFGAVIVRHDQQDAAVAAADDPAAALPGDLAHADSTGAFMLFSRKLRRRQPPLVGNVREEPNRAIEWKLFRDAYKGVTDIVTNWVWPVPAFWVVRLLARLHVTPNMVTTLGILLTIFTGLYFAEGRFAAGLGTAWAMTFLDTVDGKLARVTCTSTWLGNILDHVPDVIHPPAWWACLAYGLVRVAPVQEDEIWLSCAVILGTYVAGRAVEQRFKSRHGFNQYMWRRFDSALRLVIARRNTILLLLTLGALAGEMVVAFHAVAGWSVLTVGIQTMRLFQANAVARRGHAVTPWLM